MPSKCKMNEIERDLIEGLEGFVADLRSGKQIEKMYTCRHVVLQLRPQPYTPARVKKTRRLLNASQALFAQFLGVSVEAVRAWEQGKTPSAIARRFMDEIRRNPTYWSARLREAVKVRKTSRS